MFFGGQAKAHTNRVHNLFVRSRWPGVPRDQKTYLRNPRDQKMSLKINHDRLPGLPRDWKFYKIYVKNILPKIDVSNVIKSRAPGQADPATQGTRIERQLTSTLRSFSQAPRLTPEQHDPEDRPETS